MKVYVDISKRKIIKTDDEDRSVYVGDDNADAVKVYCDTAPTNWWLSLACKLPNGKPIPHRPFEDQMQDIEEDGKMWYVAPFTLSHNNGYLLMKGFNEFDLKINYTNESGQVIEDKTLGKFVINVNEAVEVDDDILIVGANAGEVIYQMKAAIENLASQIANDNNIKTVNELIARLKIEVYDLLKAENGVITMTPTPDQTAYKVVFGHSFKEDEDDASTRKYFLMAVVNKEEPSDILLSIDTNGNLKVNYAKFTDAEIEVLDAVNANIQTLDTNAFTSNGATIQELESTNANINTLNAVNATLGLTRITRMLEANGGIKIPKNYGLINSDTSNGILFDGSGNLILNNQTKGLVLSLLKNIASMQPRNYTFPDKDGSIMLEDDINAELIKKLDVVVHQAFKVEMEAKHNEMVGEHNALANNLQAQINTIMEVLKSDDSTLDAFQEFVNALKEAGADIEAIFTQLGRKANTTYVDEQNQLDRAYTDSQVNKAISDFNTAMAGHELEVQDQVDDYKETTDRDIAQYKAEIQSYVDKSVGDIPAILDYLIEVA